MVVGRRNRRTPVGAECALEILKTHVGNVCARIVDVGGTRALVLVEIASPKVSFR